MSNIDDLERTGKALIAQNRQLIERISELETALKTIRMIPKNHWGIQDARNIVDAVLKGVNHD